MNSKPNPVVSKFSPELKKVQKFELFGGWKKRRITRNRLKWDSMSASQVFGICFGWNRQETKLFCCSRRVVASSRRHMFRWEKISTSCFAFCFEKNFTPRLRQTDSSGPRWLDFRRLRWRQKLMSENDRVDWNLVRPQLLEALTSY